MKPASLLAVALALGALSSCGAKSGLGSPTPVWADAGDAGDASDAADDGDAGNEEAGDDAADGPGDAPADVVFDAPADAPSPACVSGSPSSPWAWTAGGPESESVSGIALAADGAVYAVGTFSGTADFDPGPALESHAAVDRLDVFLTKVACDGTHLWTRRWGGTDLKGATSGWGDEGQAVAVTPSGSVLVGGQFCSSVDFDPGPGEDVRKSASCFDGFVVSVDASGNYEWAATFGGSGRDRVGGLVVAPDGSIYAAGQFEGIVDFDPGSGQELRTSVGEIDEFVVKLTAQGNLVWVRTWGSPATEQGIGHVALTSNGAVVVAGQFSGQADFDPGPEVDLRTSAGSDDVFVMAFAASGERLWARTFGGASYDDVRTVASGPGATVQVAGAFYGPADFDPGTAQDVRDTHGLYDAYVVRLSDTGDYLGASTWGAPDTVPPSKSMVSGLATTVAADGRVFVAGMFQGQIDFDPGSGEDVRSSATLDSYDAFVIEFAANGQASAWWTFGSDGLDGAYAIAVHGSRVVVAGGFGGSIELLPKPLPGGLSTTPAGKQDAFVVHW